MVLSAAGRIGFNSCDVYAYENNEFIVSILPIMLSASSAVAAGY
jgi:hypothetical protein